MTYYLRFFILCCIVTLMAACVTTTKTQLYTLSKPFKKQITDEYTSMVKAVSQFVLVSTKVPNRLRRPQLVLNTQGGTEVVMLEHERWASAFDDELRDAIVSGIHQALGIDLNLQGNQVYYRIDVSLLAMNTLLNDHVSANFRWTITQQDATSGTSNKLRLSCDLTSYEPTAEGVQGIVKSTQTIVQVLVNDIVEHMKMMRTDSVADC